MLFSCQRSRQTVIIKSLVPFRLQLWVPRHGRVIRADYMTRISRSQMVFSYCCCLLFAGHSYLRLAGFDASMLVSLYIVHN